MISRKPVLQACLAIALFAACGDFSWRIGGHEFGVVISQAYADDDDGGDDSGSGGSTGGGSSGGSGSSERGLPFTWFSPSDREPNELVAAGLTRA
jgi:uncharacterized membrane protein YgcG